MGGKIMVKICPNCGKENQDSFKFCENCGHKFEEFNNVNNINININTSSSNSTNNKKSAQFCKYCV